MSRGRASVLSPSNQPLFEGQQVRNPTRVNTPAGGGTAQEFPFQWSYPALVNYVTNGPKAVSIGGHSISYMWHTYETAPISGAFVQVTLNGVAQGVPIQLVGVGPVRTAFALTVAPGDTVGLNVTNTGTGDGRGLWVGLTELTDNP